MKKLSFLLLIMCLAVLLNCTKAPKGSPAQNEIWLQYKSFNPSTLSVPVGTTITFTNKDNADHWVKNSSGLFSSGKISSGDNFTYTFSAPGNYSFFCPYHSNIPAEQGSINVQ